MKLRIKGNSLRLRLSRGEVVRLAADGLCAETMQLSQGAFSYEIRTDLAAATPAASFAADRMTVILPAAAVAAWSRTDAVSIRGQDGPLAILVEKDFACLQPREGEDESDLYTHPLSRDAT